MSSEIEISSDTFHGRLSSFITQWKNDKRAGDVLFNGVGSIVISVGKATEGSYPKSAALQLWLLGYEFPQTLFLITQEGITIVTTKKKASFLEKLKGGKVPIEVIVRAKDAEENAKQIEQCIDIVKKSGKKVGALIKENPEGGLAEEWKKALAAAEDTEEVDIGVALSTAALAIKDEQELVSTRDASRTSARILQRYFVEEMSQIVDQEKTIKNSAFADRVMNKIEDAKFLTGLKISDDFHSENVDWATQPTVQSGGHYDLRFASEPDDQNMHAGIIVSALGIRYQSYASLVARTYLVDPSKEQEANYKLLVQIHETILSTIKDGITTREVYSKALNVLKQKRPDLEKHFQKNVGYGIGIETKDGTLMLSPKSGRTLKDGMTLVIQTGLQDIENKGSQAKKVKTYSLVLADTVRVAASKAINFTRDAKYDAEAVCFFFDDGEDEPQEKPKAKKDSRIGAVAQSNIVSKRLRAERQATDSAEKDAARREHQKKLHQRKQAEGLEKYAENKGALNGTEEKKFKRFQSYKREEDFPNRSKELMIVADSKNQSVLVPIMGRSVPFHINTIKNASTTAEGAFTSLRINFLSPGQGVGRKDDQPFEDPTAHFVRSLTFRSKDTDRMASIAGAITDMKKEYVRREQQKKQMEDVVEQDKLTIDRRPQKLDHVFLRPALDGKRVPGEVQIHQNGIRYVHGGISSSETVDVLFNNIRHLFFQPCKSELIVIIHVHLINPIMIGKRKTKDVQFYREATDIAFDETGNRKRKHRYGDEEEFEAEEEERKRRMELDKLFLSFARKVEEADKDNHVRVDVPFRDLGFNGVPARSSVWVQPSTDCLIQITEPPFMVLSLEDIEVVHLERVQFGLKNFDMVVVFKDFNRNPQHINTIPVESLDAVKDWLDSVEIPFSEGPLNLQWPTIMKTVQADPHTFFAEGGWSFLSSESDSERDDESEDEESAFEMSEEELVASEDSSEEESDFDENASAEASEEELSGEDTEGEDWDELEKKAQRADKGGLGGAGEERETPKKKSGGGGGGGGNKRKR